LQLFSALIQDRAVPFHGTGFNAAHNDTASKLMGLNQVQSWTRARRRRAAGALSPLWRVEEREEGANPGEPVSLSCSLLSQAS
jgi:hypothetical protein